MNVLPTDSAVPVGGPPKSDSSFAEIRFLFEKGELVYNKNKDHWADLTSFRLYTWISPPMWRYLRSGLPL